MVSNCRLVFHVKLQGSINFKKKSMGIVISLYFELPCDFSSTYYGGKKVSEFLLRILPSLCMRLFPDAGD